jgi:hypothetical protein
VGDQVVMHISRDATEIQAREKPAKKPKKEPAPKKSVGGARRANPFPNPS